MATLPSSAVLRVGSPSLRPMFGAVNGPPPLAVSRPCPCTSMPGSWSLGSGTLHGGPAYRTFLSLSPQALHDLWLGLLSLLHVLTPWRYALKRIGGQFGSSVLSYFLFLKTLLAFNVLLLLPLLAFIVGVQAAFPPAPLGSVPAFTGLELLTGAVRAWWGGQGHRWGGPPWGEPHSCPVL